MNPTNHLSLAESYYHAMLAKDFDQMAIYLHDQVDFIGPLGSMHGKQAVVAAAKNMGELLQDISIRYRFSAGDQIMFAYDWMMRPPIGAFRAAVLMEFKDQLISRIELFYDARPFQEKKSEIFESN